MAKIKGPLHSDSAGGNFSNSMIFRSGKFGSVVTKSYKPGSVQKSSPSDSQLLQRQKYATAVDFWKNFIAIEKSYWADFVINTNKLLTGYSAWLSYYITIFSLIYRGRVSTINPVFHNCCDRSGDFYFHQTLSPYLTKVSAVDSSTLWNNFFVTNISNVYSDYFNRVYIFLTGNSGIIQVNPLTGSVVRNIDHGFSHLSITSDSDGFLYFIRAFSLAIMKYDSNTNQFDYSFHAIGPSDNLITPLYNRLIAYSSVSHKLYSYNRTTGATLWEVTASYNLLTWCYDSLGNLYCASRNTNIIDKYNTLTGEKTATFTMPSHIHSITCDENDIIFATTYDACVLYKIDSLTGILLSQNFLPYARTFLTANKKGCLGLSCEENKCFMLLDTAPVVPVGSALFRIDFSQNYSGTEAMQNDGTTDSPTTALDSNFGTNGSDIWNRYIMGDSGGVAPSNYTKFLFDVPNYMTATNGDIGEANIVFSSPQNGSGNGQGSVLRGGYFDFGNNQAVTLNLGLIAKNATVTLAWYELGDQTGLIEAVTANGVSGVASGGSASLGLLTTTANDLGQVLCTFNSQGHGGNNGATAGLQIFVKYN